jgi:Transcriptional regulator
MQFLMKLRVLERLGLTHKINDTALSLGLRQPTVTFHMQSLEKEAGTKLFDQRHGYVQLTDAGELYLHYAARITKLMDEAQHALDELSKFKQSRISIGASYIPATYVLPPLLKEFMNEYPDVHISMHVHPFKTVMEKLENRELDFGLVYCVGEKIPELEYKSLGQDELVIVYSPESGIDEGGTITASNLSRCPLIQHGVDSSTRLFVENWFKKGGIASKMQLEVNSIETIKQMLFTSDSYSILSRLAIKSELEAGTLAAQSLPGERLYREMSLIYMRDRFMTPAINGFIQMLMSLNAI